MSDPLISVVSEYISDMWRQLAIFCQLLACRICNIYAILWVTITGQAYFLEVNIFYNCHDYDLSSLNRPHPDNVIITSTCMKDSTSKTYKISDFSLKLLYCRTGCV